MGLDNPDNTSKDNAESITQGDSQTSPSEIAAADKSLLEQMGGVNGLVSSTLPVLVLVPVNAIWGLIPALISALVIAVGIFAWSVATGKSLQPAISGLFGVIIAAGIAWYVGSAKGYFLYGIWYSAVCSVLFFLSVLFTWPAVGLIWRGINGKGQDWGKNPVSRRFFAFATLVWAVVFAARFGIQNHFYDSNATNALAVARIVMGWPLTIVALAATIWAVRKADAAENTEMAASESAGTRDAGSVSSEGSGSVRSEGQ